MLEYDKSYGEKKLGKEQKNCWFPHAYHEQEFVGTKANKDKQCLIPCIELTTVWKTQTWGILQKTNKVPWVHIGKSCKAQETELQPGFYSLKNKKTKKKKKIPKKNVRPIY